MVLRSMSFYNAANDDQRALTAKIRKFDLQEKLQHSRYRNSLQKA